MNGSDMIVSMLYTKSDIIASSTYSFCTEKSVSKYIENIKEIIDELKIFKEDFGENEKNCNVIYNGI